MSSAVFCGKTRVTVLLGGGGVATNKILSTMKLTSGLH